MTHDHSQASKILKFVANRRSPAGCLPPWLTMATAASVTSGSFLVVVLLELVVEVSFVVGASKDCHGAWVIQAPCQPSDKDTQVAASHHVTSHDSVVVRIDDEQVTVVDRDALWC